MKKLKLNLDDIKVESFHTNNFTKSQKGTAIGHAPVTVDCETESTCVNCPTDSTCVNTCANTCAYTCYNTCEVSCNCDTNDRYTCAPCHTNGMHTCDQWCTS